MNPNLYRISFLSMALLLLFLPGSGYYQAVLKNWQKPQVKNASLALSAPASYPWQNTEQLPPNLTARGVMVVDFPSAVRILEKNSDTRLPLASTTKIMTALVALEYFRLDDILTVPKFIDEGQDIKLVEGERINVESLLYALLVASANDAAETLSASYPGGHAAFVAQMNKKTESLSLRNTHFINPAGIDEDGQYASAFDLVLLSKHALQNPVFAKIVATSKITIQSVDKKMVHQLTNINQLLGRIAGVKGVKTGWTLNAGECLVTFIERNGQKILIVLLGSQDRFGETEKLINWVFGNFEWKTVADLTRSI